MTDFLAHDVERRRARRSRQWARQGLDVARSGWSLAISNPSLIAFVAAGLLLEFISRRVLNAVEPQVLESALEDLSSLIGIVLAHKQLTIAFVGGLTLLNILASLLTIAGFLAFRCRELGQPFSGMLFDVRRLLPKIATDLIVRTALFGALVAILLAEQGIFGALKPTGAIVLTNVGFWFVIYLSTTSIIGFLLSIWGPRRAIREFAAAGYRRFLVAILFYGSRILIEAVVIYAALATARLIGLSGSILILFVYTVGIFPIFWLRSSSYQFKRKILFPLSGSTL